MDISFILSERKKLPWAETFNKLATSVLAKDSINEQSTLV